MKTGSQIENLVLASGSPRRQQLLHQAGYRFQVIIPDEAVEAGVCPDQSPADYVIEASYRKAESVAEGLARATVIGADTVAVCHGQVLGKPVDRDHARRMLLTLSGQSHQVLTGVTVWCRPGDRTISRLETTELRMESIDDQELERYLDSGDWIGKAGAFGYQDSLDWISVVHGLESNVVGLPIEILGEMISQLSS